MADHSILSFQQWLAVQPGALDIKEQKKKYDAYVAEQKKAQHNDAIKAQQVADLKQKQMSDAQNGKTNVPGTQTTAAPTTQGYLTPELQSQLAQAGINPAALLSGASSTMYVGTHTIQVIPQKSRSGDPDIAGHNTIIQTEDRRPKQSVYDDYLSWTVEERNGFIKRAISEGLLNPGDGFIQGQKLWQTLVDQAADFQRAHPGQRMGPWDVMGLMGQTGAGAAGNKQAPGTVLSRSTSSNVTQYDRTATSGMARQVLQAALGRDPKPDEISRYMAAINANEKAHPSVTHSVTKVAPDGQSSVTSSSSTSTTTNPSDIILEQARATPEYGSVQAATTYYDALERALQAPA